MSIASAQQIADLKKGRLIEAESVEVGAIPWKIYASYIKYAGGYFFSFFVLLIFIINVSSTGIALASYLLNSKINSFL